MVSTCHEVSSVGLFFFISGGCECYSIKCKCCICRWLTRQIWMWCYGMQRPMEGTFCLNELRNYLISWSIYLVHEINIDTIFLHGYISEFIVLMTVIWNKVYHHYYGFIIRIISATMVAIRVLWKIDNISWTNHSSALKVSYPWGMIPV